MERRKKRKRQNTTQTSKKVPFVEVGLKKCSDLDKVKTAAQQTAAPCVKHKDKPLSNA